MLECCYRGLGDDEGRLRAAKMVFERVEKALAANPRDAAAVGNGAMALAVIGEDEQAREWAERALDLEPENYILRYNIACAYAMELDDHQRALDLVEDSLAHLGRDHVRHVQADPDLEALRDNPRFTTMIAASKARLEGTDLAPG
jgi:adenylate cyclase